MQPRSTLSETEAGKSSSMSRREAEIELGRKRFNERHDAKDRKVAIKEVDEAEAERRKELEEAANRDDAATKRERDRAGAEVIDQAQTELEAVQHLADQEETVITREDEDELERLLGNADPAAAQAVTKSLVEAQAINQPTPLAAAKGQDVSKPLNTSGRADEDVALDRQGLPEDRHTPKTQAQASKVAKGKVPAPKEVVGPGKVVNDDDPSTVKAVKVARAQPDSILDDGDLDDGDLDD